MHCVCDIGNGAGGPSVARKLVGFTAAFACEEILQIWGMAEFCLYVSPGNILESGRVPNGHDGVQGFCLRGILGFQHLADMLLGLRDDIVG